MCRIEEDQPMEVKTSYFHKILFFQSACFPIALVYFRFFLKNISSSINLHKKSFVLDSSQYLFNDHELLREGLPSVFWAINAVRRHCEVTIASP